MANPNKNDSNLRAQLLRQGVLHANLVQGPSKDKKASQEAAIASRKAELQCPKR